MEIIDLWNGIERNGKELISIEKMTKATYICSVIAHDDTRKIAKMTFDTAQEWVEAYAKEAELTIIKNKNLTNEQQ